MALPTLHSPASGTPVVVCWDRPTSGRSSRRLCGWSSIQRPAVSPVIACHLLVRPTWWLTWCSHSRPSFSGKGVPGPLGSAADDQPVQGACAFVPVSLRVVWCPAVTRAVEGAAPCLMCPWVTAQPLLPLELPGQTASTRRAVSAATEALFSAAPAQGAPP